MIPLAGDVMISFREWTLPMEHPSQLSSRQSGNDHQRNGSKIVPSDQFLQMGWRIWGLIFTFLLPGGRAENPGGVIKILKRIRLADFACAECETESEKSWGVLKLKSKLCPSAPWPTTISKYCIRSNVDIPRRPQTLVILLMVANERLGGVGAP